jgi:DNA-binding CsgD family transcriptional regulator/tetratricopeptide (TPR) repeat protein
VLSLLAIAADVEPLLLLVDDVDQVDSSSQRTLLFVARRLTSERVALVVAGRDDGDLSWRWDAPSATVGGLSRAECELLLWRHRFDVAPRVLDTLVELTAGNPLALLETVAALPAAVLTANAPIPDPPPLGRRLEHAWSHRTRNLPDDTRAAVAVVGAGRAPSVRTVEAALARRGLDLSALGPAESAGLLVVTDNTYDFSHPVLRRLVMRQIPQADRLGAFRALAEVATGTERVWYRAAAATEPDDQLAGELAEIGVDARRRSAYAESARAWRRAAELTPSRPERVRRLWDAANDAFLVGLSAEAAAWCDEAMATVDDPAIRADIQQLHGRVLTWVGHTVQAFQTLTAAARDVRHLDVGRSCALLSEATLPAMANGHAGTALDTAEESAAMAADAGIEYPGATVALAQALILVGRTAEGRASLRAAADLLAGADPVRDQQVLTMLGDCYARTGQPDPARYHLTRVIDAARRHAAPAALPMALALRSDLDCWAGRWAAAQADATEALRWAQELGQMSMVGLTLAQLGRLDALRGDAAACEDRIAQAQREAGPYHIACLDTYFSAVQGLSAMGQEEFDVAATQLSRSFDLIREQGVGDPLVVPFAADLVEACARTGDRARAEEALDWLRCRADETELAWPVAAVARCQGILATTATEAELHFEAAEAAHRRQDCPFEAARSVLCRGEALRRFRRPAAARAPLAAAHTTFKSLGATPWVRRSAAELAATGGSPAPHAAPAALDLLSPQELQVTRAIARGMNNNEAASALFVSRKTVEAHLTRVYRKLGLRSRTDLTRVLISAGLPD